MPVLEAPLYEFLSAELAGVVGTRIRPIRGSEGEGLPYISWQRISGPRGYAYDTEGAWVQARVQFSCWATTPLEAIEVSEALIEAVSGFTGDMAGLNIGRADVVLELDGYEGATKLHRRIVDVLFAYEEGAA